MHGKDITTHTESPITTGDVTDSGRPTFAELTAVSAMVRQRLVRIDALEAELTQIRWELDQIAAQGKGTSA